MKKAVLKMLLSGGVLAVTFMLNSAPSHASSLYDTLQELYNGGSSSSGSLTGGGSSSGGYSSGSSSSGGSSFGSTATSRGNISYAINQPTNKKKTDVSGNDVSGNSTEPDQPVIMDTTPIGPTVNDAGMTELYHETYGVYEERLTEGYSIYTNVSNGSITDRPVIFDVPSGVSVSMTRDGSRANFSNRAAMDQAGYYVLRFYIVDDETRDLPFSKQTVSRAMFRFRIQYDEGIGGFAAEELLKNQQQQEAVPEEFYTSIQDELSGSEGQEVQEQPQVSPDVTPEAPAEEQTEEQNAEPVPEVTAIAYSNGIDTSYDASSGFYINTLRTGSSFNTNFKNGTVTNAPMMVQTSDQIHYEVYRNGEIMEDFTPGEYLAEAGSYEVYPIEDSSSYAQAYGSERPVLKFRIIDSASPVSDLGVLNAPEGTTFSEVTLDGESVDASVLRDGKTVSLEKDGTYRVVMSSEAGMSDLSVTVDRTAPRFSVTTRPNLASISYQTADVSRVMVWRGNELVNNGNVISSVTKPGRYRMTVYDVAGNSMTRDFVVTYRINAAAVIAILILIGLLAALGIFIYKVRSGVKVV